MVRTRQDIEYAVQETSRFLIAFGRAHWEAVNTAIKYIKRTNTTAIEFSGDRAYLTAHTDSGYAADTEDRQPISGYMSYIGRCAVTWSAHKQRIVATSTVEAKDIALATARGKCCVSSAPGRVQVPQHSTIN